MEKQKAEKQRSRETEIKKTWKNNNNSHPFFGQTCHQK
jgi:hypothetical protein